MKRHVPKRIAVDSGPGDGKSTIIKALAALGHPVVLEVARAVIAEEMQKDSDILPWKNRFKFQEKVARRQLEAEAELEETIRKSTKQIDFAFFDRSLVTGVAYCNYYKLGRIPEDIIKYGEKRYNMILLLARLSAYVQDDERKEEVDEALGLSCEMPNAYRQMGYVPVTVPHFTDDKDESIRLRMQFILAQAHALAA